jgi:hypothetical protein
MEQLNKTKKIRPITFSNKLLNKIENKENKPKKRTNLNNYILKPKVNENQTVVIIETGPFLIHL